MSVVINLNEVLTPVIVALPVADRTATFTSDAITVGQGFDGVLFTVIYGNVGDGSWTPSLTECATEGGTYTDVAAGHISGALTVGTASVDDRAVNFYYHGSQPFVKLVMTETTESTTNVIAAVATPIKERLTA